MPEVDLGSMLSSSEVLDDNFIGPRPLQADANRRQEPVHALHAGGGGGLRQHDAAATGPATATPPASSSATATPPYPSTTASAASSWTAAAAGGEPEPGAGHRGQQVGPGGAAAGAGGHAQDDRAQAEEDLGHTEGKESVEGRGRSRIAASAKIVILSIYRFICAVIASRSQFPRRRAPRRYFIPCRRRPAGEAASLCGIGSRGLFPDKFI